MLHVYILFTKRKLINARHEAGWRKASQFKSEIKLMWNIVVRHTKIFKQASFPKPVSKFAIFPKRVHSFFVQVLVVFQFIDQSAKRISYIYTVCHGDLYGKCCLRQRWITTPHIAGPNRDGAHVNGSSNVVVA